MSLQKQNVNKWPSANAKQVSTHKNWEEADAWMQQDKANRVVEGVQQYLWGHKQVEWERVDKSKPFGFGWSGVSGWERSCSMVKVPPWQCPGSAPVPPQGRPGGSGKTRHSQAEAGPLWAPSHCLGCSSELPSKSPIPPPLTIQELDQLLPGGHSASTAGRHRASTGDHANGR
eukprot:scaffold37428_cov51-Phaeocystis_antarctica.AAC.2